MARQSQRLNWCYTINNYVSLPDDESLASEVKESFPDILCSYLIEAHEVGESGTVHLQGYAQLKTAMTLNQLKQICPTAHFEVAKGTPHQNYLYCAKGDQSHQEWIESKEQGPNYGKGACFLEWGQRPKAPINAHKKKPPDNTYSEALAAPSVREGMEIVRKRKARDFCLHGAAIERNLKSARTPTYSSKFLPTDFCRELLPLDKATLITGSSGTGKTQFALAHFKNPLLVSHIDKLKTLTPDHDGIVFDDMSFTHWPAESVIHLLDFECEREIHVRYGTVTIPANIRKIFTHNKKNPFYEFDCADEQKVAIERRYNRVEITDFLYTPKFTTPLQSQPDLHQRLVGLNTTLPARYPMPERFPIHSSCRTIPGEEPTFDNSYEPGVMDELD